MQDSMRFPYHESFYKLKNLVLEIKDKTIECEDCGWKWKRSEGGKDPYVCHKCGHDNSED
jgi:DNA-directed RNA polymerase subunit RPC12/RpoP